MSESDLNDDDRSGILAPRRSRGAVTGALVLASNLGRAGAQWVLLWVVALVGGPADVGVYSLALAVVTPIFIVTDMSLRNVYITLRDDLRFSAYLWVRLAGIAVATIAISGAALAGIVPALVILLVGANKAADSILDLAYASLQKRFRLITVSWTSLFNSAISVAFGVAAYATTHRLELALIGSLLGSVFTALIVVIPTFRHEARSSIQRRPFATATALLLRAGLPSGLAFASVSTLTYLPVYLLAPAGETVVGIFATVAYFPVLANLFYSSVQQTALNSFVAAYSTGGAAGLTRVALRMGLPLLATGLVGGFATASAGPWAIQTLYGDDFRVTVLDLLPIGGSIALLPIVYVTGSVLPTLNRYGAQLGIAVASLAIAAGWGFATQPTTLFGAAVVVLVGTIARVFLGLVVTGVELSPLGRHRRVAR